MTNTEFEQFIEKNKDRMYRFAFSILRNHEDAKDAVQEVVLELWKKKMRLDKSKNVDSFCMTAIKNYSLDLLRKKKLENRFITNLNKGNTENQNFENIDLISKLKNELKNLTDQQRMALELKDFQGYKYEEISEILQCSVNAIRANVSRGRKRLYEIFREELK
jgi:RNA polymerase sigma factor (sigma-70 family)